MISFLLVIALVLPQDSASEPPILRVGETLEGEITDADPVVRTPTLDARYTTAPTLGKTILLEVEEPGTYSLELRSYLFDAYLALRDESEAILAEDDDGLIGTHSRIVVELSPGRRSVEACALHGDRGAFELRLRKGREPERSPQEERALDAEDLALRVRYLEAQAPDSEALMRALHDRSESLRDAGAYEEAQVLCARYMVLAEKLAGPSSPEFAHALNDEGRLCYFQGDYAAARLYYERALAIREKVLGPEHPETATSLASLAELLRARGDYAAARPYNERALVIDEKVLGPEHPETATGLNDLALLLQAQGDYAAARPLYERALAIREKALGPEHPYTATSLNNLAELLQARGDYAAARPLYERALAIREKVLGPEHPYTATSLNNLAVLLQAQSDYVAARPLYERALAIRENVLGPEHPYTATSLNNLAELLRARGDYAAARPYCERALAIWEKVLGPEHPDTATSLASLALLLKTQGDYAAARPLYERALAIREKALGPEHPYTATSLNNMAVLLQAQGDYAAARPYCERALAIWEKVLGPEHPDTATSLASLAVLLQAQGDTAAARPYLERALAIDEKVLGPEHPETATDLNNLAVLLQAQGDTAAARPYLERALAIWGKVLGPEHPQTAASLNNLASLLRDQGDTAAARPYYERALAIKEKMLGPEHPQTAASLNNLARLLWAQGDLVAARPYHERALAIRERVLGPEHPYTAQAQSNLGILLADLGEQEDSRNLALSGLRARVRHAEKTLWSLSERERLSYLGLGEESVRGCLSDSARSALPESYELALAWRGLVSRSLLASRAQLRSSLPADAAAVIERLSGVQAELSKRLYATEIADRGRHEREIRDLRERRNALEVEVQRLSGPSLARAPKLAELEQSLAADEAFLDFLVHPFYRSAERDGEEVVRKGEWSEDHLSAWVVRNGHTLAHVDLGPAAPLEAAVKGWLDEVVSRRGISAGGGAEEAGARLRELLWDPLRASLEGMQRVFVRPDSFLGTMPLGIVPLADGRYLIEELDFVYVQAPDDIVESREHSSTASLLAVGGVDFRKRGALEQDSLSAATAVASASLTAELRGSLSPFWSRLPHTENEAQTVHDLFEASLAESERLLLTADQPSEERLKRELPRHAYVHLATHGFFHPAGTVSLWDSAREAAEKEELRGLEQETRGLVGELPGLLSGLVCAGANEPTPEGRDDGLLTAEEVLWLDLSKVELVVLSACETALGERRSGEGMIGLRRAFGLAGTKTVISSLWSVKDRSTSELMQRFYDNLWLKKQGRAEALRNAQLELLAQNRATEHDALPSTWGAFVLSGEWR